MSFKLGGFLIVMLFWLACFVSYDAGKINGHKAGLLDAERIMRPYWQTCPEPEVRYQTAIMKGDEHGIQEFISTHRYRDLTREMSRDLATCNATLKREYID